MWEDTHNEEAQSVTSKCAAEWIQSNRTPPWDLNVEIPAWVLKRAARLDPDCWPTFERLFMRGRAEYLSEPERAELGTRTGSGNFGPVRCRCAALAAHRDTWEAAAAHLLELPASGSVHTNVHKSVRVVLQPPVFSSGEPALELTPGITALVFTTKVTETIDSAEAVERPAVESVKPIRVAELKAMAQAYRRARHAATIEANDGEVVPGGAPGGGPYPKNPPALPTVPSGWKRSQTAIGSTCTCCPNRDNAAINSREACGSCALSCPNIATPSWSAPRWTSAAPRQTARRMA